eukprot:138503-Pelagomonas_calceolata.AAC.3
MESTSLVYLGSLSECCIGGFRSNASANQKPGWNRLREQSRPLHMENTMANDPNMANFVDFFLASRQQIGSGTGCKTQLNLHPHIFQVS